MKRDIYTIRIWNGITGEIMEVMETQGFSKRTYKHIVETLFWLACDGIENRSLYADIYHCEASKLKYIPLSKKGDFTISADTIVSGCNIWLNLWVNHSFIRCMAIAF